MLQNLAPTWDLFIIVFFAIIIAYSLIIGRSATLKVIIATYIAILATDGVGNLVQEALLSEDSVVNIITLTDSSSIMVMKILIFVLGIVVLTTRGNFLVDAPNEHHSFLNTGLLAVFGFLSAGLIVSTILVYATGNTFLDRDSAIQFGIDIAANSYLARTMTENYDVWFALPAVAFVLMSLGHGPPAAQGED